MTTKTMKSQPKTVASNNGVTTKSCDVSDKQSAVEMAMDCYRTYAREKPERVALWALGIGFVLGWKLKPW